MLFQNKINLRYCASGWFYYRNRKKIYGEDIQGPAEIPDDLVTEMSGTVGVGNLSLSALLARLKAFYLP